MADQDNIFQLVAEVGADASQSDVSQLVAEVGADASETQISQAVAEVGADASQARISQLTIELGAVVGTTPPTDTPLNTFTLGFGGLNINWYIVPQITDSEVELRDKMVKAVRVTGKVSNCNIKPYGWQPTQDIDVGDLEDGLNPLCTVFIPDTTEVVQSQRYQINCPNLMQHTVRVAGFWSGTGIPDRVDEIVYEVAQQGIRR